MIDIFEILKLTGLGYITIDMAAFIYVWIWKEIHYHFHIMLFYIPLSGIPLLLSNYKQTFKEMDEARGGLL
jgi:hypothetical protein